MTCIILEPSKSEREQLSVVLLSLGVQGVQAADRGQTVDALKAHQDAQICILDVDDKDAGGMVLLKELRSQQRHRHIKTVAYSYQSDRAFVEQMVELGVSCYLLKPFDQYKAKIKLQNLVKSIDRGISEKRRHIRVSPDPNELLRLHFRVSGFANLISGKVRNISMGGIAVELLTPVPQTVIRVGVTIPSINFSLSNKALTPATQVVLVKEKFVAMRFESLSAEEKSLIARYIYRRMSELSMGGQDD
jgi:CheY-like chemotaxis protein